MKPRQSTRRQALVLTPPPPEFWGLFHPPSNFCGWVVRSGRGAHAVHRWATVWVGGRAWIRPLRSRASVVVVAPPAAPVSPAAPCPTLNWVRWVWWARARRGARGGPSAAEPRPPASHRRRHLVLGGRRRTVHSSRMRVVQLPWKLIRPVGGVGARQPRATKVAAARVRWLRKAPWMGGSSVRRRRPGRSPPRGAAPPPPGGRTVT